MTETGSTLIAATPIPVLSYESPSDATLDAANIRWWILCGGVVAGTCGAIGPLLIVFSQGLTSRGLSQLFPDVWVWIAYPLMHVVLAALCISGMRGRSSERGAGWWALIVTAGLVAIQGFYLHLMRSIFLNDEVFHKFLVREIIHQPIELFWTTAMAWLLLRRATAEVAVTRRRFCITIAILPALVAVHGAIALFLTFSPSSWGLFLDEIWPKFLFIASCTLMFVVVVAASRRGSARPGILLLLGMSLAVSTELWGTRDSVVSLFTSRQYLAASAEALTRALYECRTWTPVIVLTLWLLRLQSGTKREPS